MIAAFLTTFYVYILCAKETERVLHLVINMMAFLRKCLQRHSWILWYKKVILRYYACVSFQRLNCSYDLESR